MGKDQELLEAARNGNVSVVEKILNQRAKRSGPLASLRRGPGANVQDSSGYTPLHHAALNGHKEIVRLLLEHEASPNVPDAKGSSPLHLASWAGHVEIVRLLLMHGPALTNVNVTTRDSESALHCAAQYGHTRVVAMLLNHGVDPTVRSVRDETALDLACQYGRLETVELLVRTHPELLEPYRALRGYFPHTPLHRASKNGHKAVVSVLLGAGFSPNTRTPSGTALHEAALCGKAGAARALLAGGADPRACDRQGLTVHDLLKQFPNHVTHDILSIINEYRMCNGFDSESEEHLPPIPVQECGPGSPYDNVRSMQLPAQQRQSTRAVWERRDTESDGRRVSGTSAISMDSETFLHPSLTMKSTTLSVVKTPPSHYMLKLASNCFGFRKRSSSISEVSSSSIGYYSTEKLKYASSNRSNTLDSNLSTLRIGRSKFFRRRRNMSNEELVDWLPNSTSTNETSHKEIRHPARDKPNVFSLANIVEVAECLDNGSDDSDGSFKSVSNSIYADCSKEFDSIVKKTECNSLEVGTELHKSDNETEINEVYRSDSGILKPLSLIFDEIHKSFMDKTVPIEHNVNIDKSQSLNERKVSGNVLRYTHSNVTLKNWTGDRAEFKNTHPNYSDFAFRPNNTEEPKNSIYYASLDFGSEAKNENSMKRSEEGDNVYEPYEFTPAIENKIGETVDEVELRNEDSKRTLSTIQECRQSSTVFVPLDILPSVAKFDQVYENCIIKPRDLKKISYHNIAMANSSSEESLEEALTKNDIKKLPRNSQRSQQKAKLERKLVFDDDNSLSHRSSLSGSVDGGLPKSWENCMPSETRQTSLSNCGNIQISENKKNKNITSKTSSTIPEFNDSQKSSIVSKLSTPYFDSTTDTMTSDVSTENTYLPMSGVLKLSQKSDNFNSLPISYRNHEHEKEETCYENLEFFHQRNHLKSHLASHLPPNSVAYHMRGAENCIYKNQNSPDEIYTFDPHSTYNFNVKPFFKSPTTASLKYFNICYCKSTKSDIEKVNQDLINDCHVRKTFDKSHKQRNISENNFIFYCGDVCCNSDHKKTSTDFSHLFVSYNVLTHSVSFPNLPQACSDIDVNKPRLSENLALQNAKKINVSPCKPNTAPIELAFTENEEYCVMAPKISSSSSLSFHSTTDTDEVTTTFFNSHYDQSSDKSRLNRNSSEVFVNAILDLKKSYEFEKNLHRVEGGVPCPANVDVRNCSVKPLLAEGGRWPLCVRSGSDGGHFPYSKSSAMMMMDGSYHSEELSSSYQCRPRDPDQLSISSTTSSTGGPSPRERQRSGTNESCASAGGSYITMGASGYHAHSPGSNSKVSPTPPKKPPRRNLSVSPTHLLPASGVGGACGGCGGCGEAGTGPHISSYLTRAAQTRSQDDLDDPQVTSQKYSSLRHGRSVEQYVEVKASPRTRPVPQPRPSLALLAAGRRDQPVAISTMYENVVIKEQNPRRKLRRNDFRPNSKAERSSLESLLDDDYDGDDGGVSGGSGVATPLSPTHYNQPPTPDHPPPSAKQAEMSIHERIRPLSQEYKRMSRDMETETDPRFLGRCSSPSSSASTDHCVEEYVAEVPFAGLFKGSTTTLDGVGLRPTPAERPKSLRKLKSVYDTGGGGTGSNKIEYHEDPRHNIAYQSKDLQQDRDQSSILNNTSLDKSLSILSPFDEQEEWAKISEIMASFGSRLVRESVFSDELEREFQARLGLVGTGANALAASGAQMGTLGRSASSPAPNTLPGWLIAHSLPPNLETNFINNGYDNLDFINGVLEENDLAEMAIEETEYTKVMEASKALPLKIDDVMSTAPTNGNSGCKNSEESEKETDPEEVNKWLTSIGLECYQDTFRRHLYVDMERVRRIWEVELTAVLEIQKVGHRRRILASVAGRHNGPVDEIKNDLNNLQKNLQNLSAEISEIPQTDAAKPHSILPSSHQIAPLPVSHQISHQIPSIPTSQVSSTTTQSLVPPPTQSSGGETLKRSHKKNRPPPPPGPTRGADLEIRAPCELLVGVPDALRTQWRHQPFVLVTSSVMYVANYLGSTVVKELRGTESTQKSIQKLKKSNNEPRALPDIILSISYRGVKFLNTITRDLVCEHEIRNIHCACQDADDLTHFAYITKDNSTKSHYCHVFCVATMDQATEVILTLGQAFEVAYQMALREQARSNSSNQILQQAKTPTREKVVPYNQSSTTKDRPNVTHGRSHSVTEIKLNGHRLKVAPIAASLSNEDFQSTARNGDARKSPTSGGKAPIAVAEEL